MSAGDRVYRTSDGRVGTLIRWGSSVSALVHFDGDQYYSKKSEGLIPRSEIALLPYKEK